MAVFFIIPIVAGALAAGSAATGVASEPKQATPTGTVKQATTRSIASAPTQTFDTTAYKSEADCLTAAALAGARLDTCSPQK